MDELLEQTRIPLPKLAELSGVSAGYLKQLSAGNYEAGPDTRAKLAAALRAHSETLSALADQLDP